jgi:4-hydroxyphenylpyruvate dioxygenase
LLEPIVERLRAIDYTGAVSVELMNPQLWMVPPRQFGEIAMTALRKVLGLAAMG